MSGRKSSASLALVDQAIWSGGNFLVAAVAAGMLGRADFAVYLIAQAVFTIGLVTSRSVGGELLITVGLDNVRDGASSVAAGALYGLVFGLAAFVVGTALQGMALGLVYLVGIPIVCTQDATRYRFIHEGRLRMLVVSDFLWTISTSIGLVVLVLVSTPTLTTTLLIWSLGAAVGLIPGLRMKWFEVHPRRWLLHHRNALYALFLENGLVRSAPMVAMVGAGSLMVASDFALVGLARTMIAPVQLAFAALVPLAVARYRRSQFSVPQLERRLVTQFALIGAAGGLTVLAISPFLASLWADYGASELAAVVGAFSVMLTFAGAMHGFRASFRIRGALSQSVGVQALAACLIVALGCTGGWLLGPIGLVGGFALANLAGCLSYLGFDRKEMDRMATTGV